MSRFELGYRPALDGLRGCAVLAVVGIHLTPAIVRGGFVGVDLFFVLSGFLITSLLMEEQAQTGSLRFGKFYARRALRLMPAFFVWVLACVALAPLMHEARELISTRTGAVYAALYVANWAKAKSIYLGLVELSWSLSIEEQFYLVWPALLWLALTRLSRRATLACVAAGILAVMITRAARWTGPGGFARLYAGTDTRADALLWGCGAAMLLQWQLLSPSLLRMIQRLAPVAAIVFLAFVARATYYAGYMYYAGFTLVAAASAILIVSVVTAPEGRLARALSHDWLTWVGKLSYSMYLWHYPVIRILSRQLHVGNAALHAAQAIGIVVMSVASHYLVERPFLRLKRRYAVAR